MRCGNLAATAGSELFHLGENSWSYSLTARRKPKLDRAQSSYSAVCVSGAVVAAELEI